MALYQRLQLPADALGIQRTNKALWNDGRSIMGADFYTLGYGGRHIDELLDLVEDAGVLSLIDIRFSPVSMYKPEFSKTNLERMVRARGLHYVHLPQLGVPRDIRAKAIQTGSRRIIWEWYDAFVARLKNQCRFLPMNRSTHRHRLFLALEDRGLRGFDL